MWSIPNEGSKEIELLERQRVCGRYLRESVRVLNRATEVRSTSPPGFAVSSHDPPTTMASPDQRDGIRLLSLGAYTYRFLTFFYTYP